MLSRALLLKTRLPAAATGLLAVLCFGMAWLAGIIAGTAGALHSGAVMQAATLVGLLVSTDGLWRGALYNLEPVALLVASNGGGLPNPFATAIAPTPAFTVWCLFWIAAALGGGGRQFPAARRLNARGCLRCAPR